MAEIDKKKVLDKIKALEDSLSKLKKLALLSLNEFISDFKYFDSAKYNLQTAIEAMIDIGNHIISRRELGIPKTYRDTFEILNRSGIIGEKEAGIYKLMAKFRNRIVHFYDEVDDKEVYAILQNDLGDFDLFIQQISRLL